VIKDAVLSLLRSIANASTISECTKAIEKLQKSVVWKSNDRFRAWMQNTWLPEKKVILKKLFSLIFDFALLFSPF